MPNRRGRREARPKREGSRQRAGRGNRARDKFSFMHSCLVSWRVRLSDYRLSATASDLLLPREIHTDDVETRAISSHCFKIYDRIDNINLPVGLSPSAIPPFCISQNTPGPRPLSVSPAFPLRIFLRSMVKFAKYSREINYKIFRRYANTRIFYIFLTPHVVVLA